MQLFLLHILPLWYSLDCTPEAKTCFVCVCVGDLLNSFYSNSIDNAIICEKCTKRMENTRIHKRYRVMQSTLLWHDRILSIRLQFDNSLTKNCVSSEVAYTYTSHVSIRSQSMFRSCSILVLKNEFVTVAIPC